METREKELLQRAGELFSREPRLIELPEEGWAVFVGDTHGDLEASERVIARYLRDGFVLVFLGDYVDRGPHSRENILFLLERKVENPEQVFLLMGNHEGWQAAQFSPADFWLSLEPEEAQLYAETLIRLPLAAVTANGIIALHGALPELPALEALNEVEPGSAPWRQITWGDWYDAPGQAFGEMWGRPGFGRDYFEGLMHRYGKNVLIRSHQPNAPLALFADRCITIFTSSAYGQLRGERTIALAPLDPQRSIRNLSDLQLERI